MENQDLAALRHTIERMARRLRKQAQYGLTPSQITALKTCERHGPIRLGELARLEQVGKATLSRLVANLESAGFVTKLVDPSDGRGYVVELTPAGRHMLQDATDRQDAYLRQQLERLHPAERAILFAAEQVIEQLLDEQM